MYEGRTRGKRMKYTYSEDEDDVYSDATTSRRSTRNTRAHTPAEASAPTVTQSGRQVKARQGGAYGESILSGAQGSNPAVAGYDGASDELEHANENDGSRPRRAASSTNGTAPKGGRHIEGYNDVDEMTSDEEDDASEQDYGDDEEEEDVVLASDADDQDELSDADSDVEMENGEKQSLVVKLPLKTPTPEKKQTIKLHVSPDKNDASKSQQPFSNANGQADSSIPQGKENTRPASTVSLGTPEDSKPSSTAPAAPSAKSPLAFRGSPEKPAPYKPSIDVGSGGL